MIFFLEDVAAIEMNCGPSWMLRTLQFIKLILDVVYIVIPIALIILIIIDLSKGVISSDGDKISKATKLSISRLISAIIIFCIPWIVNFIMNVLGSLGINSVNCIKLEEEEIKALADKKEEEEKIEEEAKIQAQKEIAEKHRQQLQKEQKDYDDGYDGSDDSSIPTVKDFVKINKTGCDGVVYFSENTFYTPNNTVIPAGAEGTQGSAINNYNKYFYELLEALIEAGKKEGYTITPSNTHFGSWRPIEIQTYFYCCYTGNYAPFTIPKKYQYNGYSTCNGQGCNSGNQAAKPGVSYHGYGIASDLGFSSNEAIRWAHKNAHMFYLNFAVASEYWHIQPANVIEGDNHGCTKDAATVDKPNDKDDKKDSRAKKRDEIK